MNPRTHPAAVRYALEQELFEANEELFSDYENQQAFLNRQKKYLGSVKRGERTIHYWWVISDEELLTIDEGSGGVIISGNQESPLNRIHRVEMTVEELEKSGQYKIPPTMMREIGHLSKMGASVITPLEYRACDVLLPLLGIKIIPESDAEYVAFEQVDLDSVLFYRFPKIVR